MIHSHTPSPALGRLGVSKLFGALVTGSLLVLFTACSDDTQPDVSTVHVRLLGFNDFHGNLEPPTGSNGRVTVSDGKGGTTTVNAGGAAYLAHHINKLREEDPAHTVVVAAGDLIGASPVVSGIYHDEPTIDAMNMVGLDISSVGNHEFDEGKDELLRMQNGGCHPVDGCQKDENGNVIPFTGAKFHYLSANVFTDVAAKKTLLPAYEIREFDGVKVAFIGMTLEGTAKIVNPAGIQGLTFQDEADTVNALVPDLKSQGVETIVVLIHEGGLPVGLYNECTGVSGAIVDIVHRFDPAVDVVISGHTHQAYNCRIDNKIVTSALNYGRVLTQVDLELDRNTHDVVHAQANNLIVTHDNADNAMDVFVKGYVAKSSAQAKTVVGNTPVVLKAPVRPVPAGESGESSLGSMIADAMLWATKDEQKGGAVIAFQNAGGVRAELDVGDITYSEIFAVQPFANNLTTLTLTGQDIKDVLEQQFAPYQSAGPLVMQVSEGFSYTWSASGPVNGKIDPASIMLNGAPIDLATSYRVTVNNFMAAGGDGYTVFTKGKDVLTGPIDLDAATGYLSTHKPLSPPSTGRIVRVP
ncbi:MAG: bifunctional metallophosphatase/5'-nucleotidase [Hyalangium sp.]|uniref:bifunctional metallophosphatase/5'-nucleotidase n=1 Tax=Hyalangium sp. TaxID=2028555 RepID=UPI00389A102F